MSMGKKSNDATKKKGMALRDDTLENVTGGETITIRYRTFDNREKILTNVPYSKKDSTIHRIELMGGTIIATRIG